VFKIKTPDSSSYQRSAIQLGKEGVHPLDKSSAYLHQSLSAHILYLSFLTISCRFVFFLTEPLMVVQASNSGLHKFLEQYPALNSSLIAMSVSTLWLYDVAESMKLYLKG